MNLVEQAQKFLEKKGFIVESETDLPAGWPNEESANVFYYIGRLIKNKGPQTEAAIEKYLNTKFDNKIPLVGLPDEERKNYKVGFYWFLNYYFVKEGRKWDFDEQSNSLWQKVAKWHEAQDIKNDPYAAIVKVFWDWYKEKKAGNNVKPDNELIKFVNNASEETIEKAFGPKYAKFAIGMLDPYLKSSNLTEEDKLIQKFWDWHRAKKAGKPYQLDQDTIDGLVVFLRKPKAVEVLQQYYYYFVRVIEKMSDKTIKTPINTDGLQKELKRIMDNLENDDFVDELERIERNRLRGGDMTAGPVFVLPVDVIKTIRTLAKDEDNIVKSKVGKIDKDQVKDCYVYCNNELNKKFHVGKTGIFDLNIQDFYDTYKIVFQRGFNTKTLHKIFDEVCQYLLDQLDKGTAEYWKNRGKIDVDEVDDFNEAYRMLKDAGYRIVESVEDDALEYGLTPHESANLFVKNRKPYWAKSVKNVGRAKQPITPSGSHTERAMRSVRGEREPYRESDWRRDNDFMLKSNKRLAEKLKKAGLEWDKEYISKDMLSIFIGNYEFRIFEDGPDYLVMRRVLDNMLDKKTVRLNSLKEIVNYVKENV